MSCAGTGFLEPSAVVALLLGGAEFADWGASRVFTNPSRGALSGWPQLGRAGLGAASGTAGGAESGTAGPAGTAGRAEQGRSAGTGVADSAPSTASVVLGSALVPGTASVALGSAEV